MYVRNWNVFMIRSKQIGYEMIRSQNFSTNLEILLSIWDLGYWILKRLEK